jgi:hypothetical protein
VKALWLLSAGLAFGQLFPTSTTVVQPDGNNLHVVCDSGCSGGGTGSSVDITAVGGNAVTTTVPVSGTFWQATQPVSLASLPLPTGAATEVTLASIDAKTPALGQALAAGSVPVVLTAAQLSTLTPLSSVGITGSVAVTGTFWQATQPVSIAATVNTSAAQSGTWTVQPGNTANTTAWLVTGTGGTFPATQSGTWNIGTVTTLTGITNAVTTATTDTAPATVNITAQDSASATASGANSQTIITGTPTANSAAAFALSSMDTIRVQVTGTWTGTLQSEASMDGGTTWYILGVHQLGTAYTVATFTANFSGNANVGGLTNYRLRSTAAWTGTATVRIAASQNGASVYVANGLNIQDATTQTQKLVVDSTGALSANVTRVGSNTVSTAATGVQKVGVVGNAGAIFDGATAATVPANAIYQGGVGKSAQPTAVSDGQMVGALRSLDGAEYIRYGGPISWSCGLNAIGTTLTQCQAAPGAGLSLYITDVVNQSQTSTAGLMTLRFGTGTNCGTGTGNLFFNSASALMASPANTAAVNHFHLTTPIKVTANNAVCVLGVATNTTNITITGFTAP